MSSDKKTESKKHDAWWSITKQEYESLKKLLESPDKTTVYELNGKPLSDCTEPFSLVISKNKTTDRFAFDCSLCTSCSFHYATECADFTKHIRISDPAYRNPMIRLTVVGDECCLMEFWVRVDGLKDSAKA